MKTSLWFRNSAYALSVAIAAVAGVGLWRVAVWAELDFSDTIHVEIEDADGLELTIYTPGADVPATIPVGVRSEVRPEFARGLSVVDVDSVVTALGGTLNQANGEITGELDDVAATLTDEIEGTSDYVAVIDLANLEFEQVARGTPGLFAEDFIRTLAIVSGYYTGARTISDIVEGDEIGVAVGILDSADIDSDGNCIPDADALLEGDLIQTCSNGVITIVRVIDGSIRGLVESNVISQFYESQFGPVEVTLESPTLADLQDADSDFDVFNTARLIVSIGGDAGDLVDEPSGTDPVSEFDLVDGTDPLPPPENVFVRATIAVATVARGAAVDWTFVDDLPGGLDFTGTLSGPGVAEVLQGGTDVGVYTYGLTFTQDGQDIIAEAGNDAQTDPWAEVDDVALENEDNADDDADARIEVAADGDDTVRATFSIGSAIFGSNVAPRAASGGGSNGGSGCFVATAAYGTPMAAEIQSLRDVRDAYLIGNPLGAAFVDTYYRVSPPIAQAVAEYPALKQAVRTALAPVIAVSTWVMASPGAFAAAVFAIALFGLVSALRVSRPYGTRMRK